MPGDDIDCWMEVQEGKGPWARQVGGLVPIGSPLTLVIAINDKSKEFDMRIKRCSASDGSGPEIELTDHDGCVLRPSLLTPFAKVRDFGGKATLVAYSHLYAFKFPDKMDVFVHCIVEVCRHGCADSCSHEAKEYYHPRETYDNLESKKHQKLVELAKSDPPKPIHVSVNHQPSKLLSGNSYIFPGRERNREILVPAAQTQIQQTAKSNSSHNSDGYGSKRIQYERVTFKPPTIVREAQKAKETNSQMDSSASNVLSVFTDIGNSVHTDHDAVSKSHASHHAHDALNEQQASVETHHKIIGHHAHWIPEAKKQIEDHPEKQHHSLPLTGISYQPPQPESWVADNVKTFKNQEIFYSPHASKSQVGSHHYRVKTPEVHSQQVPQPEPAAWSADDVKPLTKHEVFHSHSFHKSGKDSNSNHYHLKSPSVHTHQVPQPEPASWSGDNVKPLTKQEVFHIHQTPKPDIDIIVHHYNQKSPSVHKVTPPAHISWSTGEPKTQAPFHPYSHKEHKIPQPEPASWTFEEINPMHSPEVLRVHVNNRRPDVFSTPGPTTWTVEEVKTLSKDDLRLISLNHKMKSGSHLVHPIYREIVHPLSTTVMPQPIYVSRYPTAPRNMSNPGMMKMMMMPTLLPYTYQTAQWPQRDTARYLKPQRHHYPYPIPQFSPHQQMMMSVIADRRMDEDGEDIDTSALYHNLEDDEANSGQVFIGDTARRDTFTEASLERSGEFEIEETPTTKNAPSEEQILIGQIFKSKATPEDKEGGSVEEIIEMESPITIHISTEEIRSTSPVYPSTEDISKISDGPGARPPISSFVQPSLDGGFDTDPETKDRTAYGPRSLDRRKRSSEPVFGVQQKFQAIAPSDLAFEWNLTAERATVYRGRREDIVYGICMSPAGMSAGVGFILILTLLAIIASVVLYEHSCQLTNKTSQLSFITRNFNGRFEALYKITRPYLYSDNRNVR